VLTINARSPDLHVNNQHYRYCYKHSSSIDTSHRPFSAAASFCGGASILPERIHQRCTDRASSVLTINRPYGFARKLPTLPQGVAIRVSTQATDPFSCSFCGGSWYTTRKDPPKMYGPRPSVLTQSSLPWIWVDY
jgi:hypothetical protein